MSVYQHAGCDYLLWEDHLALSIPAGYRSQETDCLYHTTWTSQTWSTEAPTIFLIHILLCHSLTNHKIKETKKKTMSGFLQAHPESGLPVIAWQLLALCVLKFKAASHTVYPSEQQSIGCLRRHIRRRINICDLFCQFNLATQLIQNKNLCVGFCVRVQEGSLEHKPSIWWTSLFVRTGPDYWHSSENAAWAHSVLPFLEFGLNWYRALLLWKVLSLMSSETVCWMLSRTDWLALPQGDKCYCGIHGNWCWSDPTAG